MPQETLTVQLTAGQAAHALQVLGEIDDDGNPVPVATVKANIAAWLKRQLAAEVSKREGSQAVEGAAAVSAAGSIARSAAMEAEGW